MANQPDGDDVVEAIHTLREMKSQSENLERSVKNLISRIEEGAMDTSEGLSFLEVKNHLMLEYLIDLTQIGLLKCQGLSIQENPAIDRLIENRTYLEKMKPIEKKLQYQVDKLVKTAVTGVDQNDPLRLKPNPDNLMSKMEGESSSEESGDEGGRDKTKKYRPPKLAPVYYEGDDTVVEKEERERKRQKSRALNSSIMQELRQEYYEGPEEIRDDMNLHRLRANKREKERTEYEEEKFFRMIISKKEKAANRRMATMSGLSELTRGFGDISALSEEAGAGPAKKKKRSSKAKGKGKKSGKKKFRK